MKQLHGKGKKVFIKKFKKNSDGVVKYSMHKENKKYFNWQKGWEGKREGNNLVNWIYG